MRLYDTSIEKIGEFDRQHWRSLACHNGRLVSPYLLPEFADLIHAERGDVRVVIAEDNHKPVGYFAYHAPVSGIARPVGAPLSDYQGFASKPDFKINGQKLLDAMQAKALIYDNWYGQAPGKVRQHHGSSVIDLTQGVEAWKTDRKARSKSQFKKIAQRIRKAEREFGDVRIVFGDPNGERFEFLRKHKSAQFRETGLVDLTKSGWTARAFEEAAAHQSGALNGLVASLYLGDKLVAVEMGLVAENTYHSWVPTYDPAFSKVSPGLLLLNGIIEHAQDLGLDFIDLGAGDQCYKKYFTDFETPMTSGRVLKSSFASARIKTWEWAEHLGAHLPGRIGNYPTKLRRRWAQTAAIAPGYTQRIILMAAAFANAHKRLTA